MLVNILKKENYTFGQLADYIGLTESELTKQLNNKTLDLKSLELISKTLRVPLYSFFRNDSPRFDFNQKPYYVNKLWTGDDESKTTSELKNEINLFKEIIALKEIQLKKLEK